MLLNCMRKFYVIRFVTREVVDIDKIQYGLMSWRGTADAVFVLRRLTEKFIAKNKKFLFVFVDMEKIFDQVPEYLADEVISLYKGCKAAVSVDEELSSSFSLKVDVHQGSALCPL